VLAFPGVSRIFPADAALGLSLRIMGEKNTAVNTIFGQSPSAKQYILSRSAGVTLSVAEQRVVLHIAEATNKKWRVDRSRGPQQTRFWSVGVRAALGCARKSFPDSYGTAAPGLCLFSDGAGL